MKNILITGGTGSLGRALISHLLETDIERVVSYSRDEVKAGDLMDDFPDDRLRTFIGDVRDEKRLIKALYGIDVIIHAAALKRITQSVYSPGEIVKTNVLGTVNVIDAALYCGVEKVMFVSSDKSTEATNLYGASKFTAETYAVQANSYTYPHGTKVSAVRYGNVIGSRGSVVPLWREIHASSQPLPLTDDRMTRFLITMPQAVGFVLSSIEMMQGGEVFIPKLPSALMRDVAEAACPDSTIHVVGIRPGGEKLHEKLLSDEEVRRTKDTGDRYIIVPSHQTWADNEWDGEEVEEDFVYRSDRFLITVDEISELL